MRRAVLHRPGWSLIAALAVALLTVGIVGRSWIAAQARAVVVLSTTIETPVLSWAIRQLTREASLTEIEVRGVPTTLGRPAGTGPWPTFVFLNGATELGRAHPDVRRLARGLARAGFLVFVPDLPGLVEGELSERTVAAAIALARAASSHPDGNGRVALFGVSLGAAVALLAAAEPGLEGRISIVVGIAPYTDLVDVVRLATTAHTQEAGRLVRYPPGAFLSLAVARSLAAGLPAGPERERLRALLGRFDTAGPALVEALRRFETDDPVVQAALAVLTNEDPSRFEELYRALPAGMRATVERLSPIRWAQRLTMPIELASAPRDAYFPPAHSKRLAAAAPDVAVTVTEAFAHAIPRPSLADPQDLLAFDGWAVRSLRKARG